MKIEAGKELEFVRDRLSDIAHLADKTEPVDGDWEGYAKQLCRVISDQACEAKAALTLWNG